ncbi:MAG: hypothetical protein Q8P45_01830 [Candidatus Harrisonbacteria bacterium]|nr:hypothetical protein [Candidatus Harrisonbacteria bacterium]
MVPQPNQFPQAQRDNLYGQLGPEGSDAPSFSWRLFTFSLVIFIVVIAIFLGLRLGYEPFLRSRIVSADEQLAEIGRQIPETEQERFISFYSQLLNLQSLLSNHTNLAPFFETLEANTHVGVFFTSMNFDVAQQKITLEGVAPDYDVLGQQLSRLEQVSLFDRYLLSESQENSGRVEFRLLLFLNQDILMQDIIPEAVEEEAPAEVETEVLEESESEE